LGTRIGKLYQELEDLKPRFSICIPVWEQHGFGLQYLKDLIHSIQIQTFHDWEIVISDHSQNFDISDYCFEEWKNDYTIRYVKYDENYGNGVANLNNALKMANGEIIKIMFQDDFMFTHKCLEALHETFQDENTKWAVCGCNHTRDGVKFERPMVPSWNNYLLEGINTISSPSVLAFRNENIELFDENLTMLMDVEYYYRLGRRYGLPTILEDCLVTNRCHENQISSRYSGNLGDEVRYCKEKYDSN
jgi:glycosyltransferase involved in cell wall biosynthesis